MKIDRKTFFFHSDVKTFWFLNSHYDLLLKGRLILKFSHPVTQNDFLASRNLCDCFKSFFKIHLPDLLPFPKTMKSNRGKKSYRVRQKKSF